MIYYGNFLTCCSCNIYCLNDYAITIKRYIIKYYIGRTLSFRRERNLMLLILCEATTSRDVFKKFIY